MVSAFSTAASSMAVGVAAGLFLYFTMECIEFDGRSFMDVAKDTVDSIVDTVWSWCS